MAISRSAHRRRHQEIVARRARRGHYRRMTVLATRVAAAEISGETVVRGVTGRFVRLQAAADAVKRFFRFRGAPAPIGATA